MSMDRIVYDGWLKVAKRSEGNRVYDILLAPSAVAAWVVNSVSEVLLVKQYRPAVGFHTWEIPAGVLDKPHLTKEETLREELQEEAELYIRELIPLVSYVPHIGHSGSQISIYYGFTDEDRREKRRVKDDDVTEAGWFSFSRLEEMIDKKEIVDEKTMLAYYCYIHKRTMQNME